MLPQKLYTDQTSDSSQEVYEVIPLKRCSQENHNQVGIFIEAQDRK